MLFRSLKLEGPFCNFAKFGLLKTLFDSRIRSISDLPSVPTPPFPLFHFFTSKPSNPSPKTLGMHQNSYPSLIQPITRLGGELFWIKVARFFSSLLRFCSTQVSHEFFFIFLLFSLNSCYNLTLCSYGLIL